MASIGAARAVEIEDDERRLLVPDRGQHVLSRPLEVDVDAQLLGGGRDLDREDQVVHYADDHVDQVQCARNRSGELGYRAV